MFVFFEVMTVVMTAIRQVRGLAAVFIPSFAKIFCPLGSAGHTCIHTQPLY
jgi:hypothetical protein